MAVLYLYIYTLFPEHLTNKEHKKGFVLMLLQLAKATDISWIMRIDGLNQSVSWNPSNSLAVSITVN